MMSATTAKLSEETKSTKDIDDISAKVKKDVLEASPINSVTIMYGDNNLLPLMNALINKNGYKRSKETNLVVKENNSEPSTIVYCLPVINFNDSNSNIDKSNNTLNSLKETICLALLKEEQRTKTILFPFHIKQPKHWITGHIGIEANTKIVLRVHDSYGNEGKEYKELDELSKQLKEFLDVERIFEDFVETHHGVAAFTSNRESIKLRLNNKGNKIAFENRGKSNIRKIQKADTYCGGYTVRLIGNLVNKLMDGNSVNENELEKETIWNCSVKMIRSCEMRMRKLLKNII